MNYLRLFLGRLRAALADYAALVILILCVVASVAAFYQAKLTENHRQRVIVVDQDRGGKGDRLCRMLLDEEDLDVVFADEKEGERLLMRGAAQFMAVLSPDFTEKLENCDFDAVVQLRTGSESGYTNIVSEPIINSVMKLWFEEQTVHDLEKLLQDNGLELTGENLQRLQTTMKKAWKEGAIIRVVANPLDRERPLQNPEIPNAALCFFCALIPLYLVVSGCWILQEKNAVLLRRIRRTGCPLWALFLTQGLASGVLCFAAGALVCFLSAPPAEAFGLLGWLGVYLVAAQAMAMILCCMLRSLSVLLLVAPTVVLSFGVLSGLMTQLPEWSGLLVELSGILPGRQLYEGLAGVSGFGSFCGNTAIWLLAAIAFTCLADRLRKKNP